MYELFEHTADLGLRATAPDLDGLFAEMAKALLAAMVENPDEVRGKYASEIRVDGTDREYLLFDWLRDLLNRFTDEKVVFRDFTVRVSESGLTATAFGEPVDPARHLLNHEVKAVTYHGLTVERTADGWQAEVIVDI